MKRIVDNITFKKEFEGKTFEITLIKLNDGKWYELKQVWGLYGFYYVLREVNYDK